MDKAKLIDLLYDVLPYVQGGEQFEERVRGKRVGESVSVRVWEVIKTLEKWEGA
jgi:hypothetical protein